MKVHKKQSYLKTVLGFLSAHHAFGGPVQANLSLTNRCNLRCRHCYYHSPFVTLPGVRTVRGARLAGCRLPDIGDVRALQKIEADPRDMNNMRDGLLNAGSFRFHFSGGGEPFMHPAAMEFIGRVKHAGADCDVNTNALLISPEMAKQLVSVGCNALRVKVSERSGLEAGALETVLGGLGEEKRRQGRSKPEVTLVCIIRRENMNDLAGIANMAVRVGAGSVQFRPMDDAGDPGLVELIPPPACLPNICDQLRTAGQILDENNIDHTIDTLVPQLRERLDTGDFYRTFPCYYGWLSVGIDADGGLYLCCRAYESLWNVFDDGFRRVWESTAYKRKRLDPRKLPTLGRPLQGCNCYACIHYTANFRVAKLFHPLRAGRFFRDREQEARDAPCCRCFQPMGNIYREDFKRIWNGSRYIDFRREAGSIQLLGTSVSGCFCNSCPHYTANIRAHRVVHPFGGKRKASIAFQTEHSGGLS